MESNEQNTDTTPQPETKRAPRRPVLGSGRTLAAMQAEAAAAVIEDRIESLNPSPAERELAGGYDAIVERREAERAALVARAGAAVIDETPAVAAIAVENGDQSVANFLATFAAHGNAPTARIRAERKEQAAAMARPLLVEAHALLTKHGALRARHLSRIESVHGSDWPAILKAVDLGLVFDGRQNVPVNHNAVHRLRDAAAFAVGSLRSTFGDAKAGKNDIAPVSLSFAVQHVEAALVGGTAFDDLDDRPAVSFKSSLNWLRYWNDTARAIIASAEEGIARFDLALENAKDVLAGVTLNEAVEGGA